MSMDNPAPITIDDPCILFAMGRESSAFRREHRPHQAFEGAPCWAYFCGSAERSVLVVETGVGQANVARTLDWLLSRPRLGDVPYVPRLLIYAGYAGGLDASLKVGDVVLADEVIDEHGGSWRTTWPETMPTTLRRGRLLTVNCAAGTPEEKRRLAQTHQAFAVEMESALFASRCAAAGVPFGCVRAISDDLACTFSPALADLLEVQPVTAWRALKAALRHPSLLAEFWRLARDTRRASEQLGDALGELLARS